MEEENLSSKTLSLGFIKRLIFFRLPFLILIVYALLLRGYVSLGYFLFALLLLIFEIEKRYSKRKRSNILQRNKFTKLSELFHFKNYTIVTYYFLLAFTILVYIWKFVMILLSYFFQDTYKNIIDRITPQEFELYFAEKGSTKNILLMMLPNLGVLIMVGTVLLFRSYLENIKISTFRRFRGLFISKYFFITITTATICVFAAIEVSLISLVFMIILTTYFILWGSMKNNKTTLFYVFAKILQVFVVFVLLAQYAISIGSIREIVEKMESSKIWSFDFVGIINLNQFSYKVMSPVIISNILDCSILNSIALSLDCHNILCRREKVSRHYKCLWESYRLRCE